MRVRDCSNCGTGLPEDHKSRVKVGVGEDLYFCSEECLAPVLEMCKEAFGISRGDGNARR